MSDIFTTITSADWRSTFAEHRDQPRGNSMKKLITLLLLGAAKLTASEDIAILKALAELESGNNPKAVGKSGERGLYQIKESTWRMHTDMPFDRAFNSLDAQLVALKHVRWLRAQIAKCKTDVQPIDIAFGWKCGHTFCLPNRRVVESNDDLIERLEYGNRFLNLFREYKHNE